MSTGIDDIVVVVVAVVVGALASLEFNENVMELMLSQKKFELLFVVLSLTDRNERRTGDLGGRSTGGVLWLFLAIDIGTRIDESPFLLFLFKMEAITTGDHLLQPIDVLVVCETVDLVETAEILRTGCVGG